MATWKYTVEILASGQPRPYADSRTHGRITFETDYYGPDKEKHGTLQKAVHIKEDRARKVLSGLGHGFTEFRYPQDCADPAKPSTGDYFRMRLDWLKEIEPGVWEWHTTSAYTD